jgi:hypothetical protein
MDAKLVTAKVFYSADQIEANAIEVEANSGLHAVLNSG